MTIGENDERQVRQFFEQLPRCMTDERNDATISYLAVRRNDAVVVIAARMLLGAAAKTAVFPEPLKTQSVRAGQFYLSEIGRSANQYVRAAIGQGDFEIPGETLQFPGGNNGGHQAWFNPFDFDALRTNSRTALLRLSGGPLDGVASRPAFDWELKAAETPFDSIDDLANEFGFGSLDNTTMTFDVVARNPVEIAATSKIVDAEVHIDVQCRCKLNWSDVTLGLRVIQDGVVKTRRSVKSFELKWRGGEDQPPFGSFKFNVDPGSTVHCSVVLDGVAVHERVIVDQSASGNLLRVAFNSFDPGLEKLREFLESGGLKKTDARLVESAFAWTLTMLGFQVFHLGGVERTQDAADLVACSPSQGLLLVECTTGVLNPQKIGNLVSRSNQLRGVLDAAGFTASDIVPILATTKPLSEVAQSISRTEKDGVLVMCQEQIDEWVELSAAAPDADRIFARAQQRLVDVSRSASDE